VGTDGSTGLAKKPASFRLAQGHGQDDAQIAAGDAPGLGPQQPHRAPDQTKAASDSPGSIQAQGQAHFRN
jgi:hypothetical protein